MPGSHFWRANQSVQVALRADAAQLPAPDRRAPSLSFHIHPASVLCAQADAGQPAILVDTSYSPPPQARIPLSAFYFILLCTSGPDYLHPLHDARLALCFVLRERQGPASRIDNQTNQSTIDFFCRSRSLARAETNIDGGSRIERQQCLLVQAQRDDFNRARHDLSRYLSPVAIFDTDANGGLSRRKLAERHHAGTQPVHHRVVFIDLHRSYGRDGCHRAKL